jgi:hypothetical protein
MSFCATAPQPNMNKTTYLRSKTVKNSRNTRHKKQRIPGDTTNRKIDRERLGPKNKKKCWVAGSVKIENSDPENWLSAMELDKFRGQPVSWHSFA